MAETSEIRSSYIKWARQIRRNTCNTCQMSVLWYSGGSEVRRALFCAFAMGLPSRPDYRKYPGPAWHGSGFLGRFGLGCLDFCRSESSQLYMYWRICIIWAWSIEGSQR